MILIVPLVTLVAFALCFVAAIGLSIRVWSCRRAGHTPSDHLLKLQRRAGRFALFFLVLFVMSRVWYLSH